MSDGPTIRRLARALDRGRDDALDAIEAASFRHASDRELEQVIAAAADVKASESAEAVDAAYATLSKLAAGINKRKRPWKARVRKFLPATVPMTRPVLTPPAQPVDPEVLDPVANIVDIAAPRGERAPLSGREWISQRSESTRSITHDLIDRQF